MPTPRPPAVYPGDCDKGFLEQLFRNQIIFHKRTGCPPDQQFDVTLTQLIELHQRGIGMDNPQLHAGILLQEPFCNCRKDAGYNDLGTADR